MPYTALVVDERESVWRDPKGRDFGSGSHLSAAVAARRKLGRKDYLQLPKECVTAENSRYGDGL